MPEDVKDLDAIVAARSGAKPEEKQEEKPEEKQEETPAEEQEETPTEEKEEEKEETTEESEEQEEEKEAEEEEEKEEKKEEQTPQEESKVKKIEEKKEVEKPITLDSEFEVDGKKTAIKTVVSERDALKAELESITKDPFLKNFIAHFQATGNARAFLESQGIDWDKEGDLDVIRRDFYKRNPDIPANLQAKAFTKELVKIYGIDPLNITEETDVNSDDYKLTLDQIRRDAKKAREAFKSEQQKFAIPEVVDNSKVRQKQADDFRKMVAEDKDVKAFKSSKQVKLGVLTDDGVSYGYEVSNPDEVVEMATTEGKFWKQFVGKDGKIDWNRLNKTIAYSQDPEAFEKQLFDWGKKVGADSKIKEDRNIDGRLTKTKIEKQSPKDEKREFLKAALQQKKK